MLLTEASGVTDMYCATARVVPGVSDPGSRLQLYAAAPPLPQQQQQQQQQQALYAASGPAQMAAAAASAAAFASRGVLSIARAHSEGAAMTPALPSSRWGPAAWQPDITPRSWSDGAGGTREAVGSLPWQPAAGVGGGGGSVPWHLAPTVAGGGGGGVGGSGGGGGSVPWQSEPSGGGGGGVVGGGGGTVPWQSLPRGGVGGGGGAGVRTWGDGAAMTPLGCASALCRSPR